MAGEHEVPEMDQSSIESLIKLSKSELPESYWDSIDRLIQFPHRSMHWKTCSPKEQLEGVLSGLKPISVISGFTDCEAISGPAFSIKGNCYFLHSMDQGFFNLGMFIIQHPHPKRMGSFDFIAGLLFGYEIPEIIKFMNTSKL